MRSTCLALLALASMAKVPQLECGTNQPVNKIGGAPDLDMGPWYMATINGAGGQFHTPGSLLTDFAFVAPLAQASATSATPTHSRSRPI